ncbi:PREDICTED: spermatogenesis-associated protein 31E1-like [Propithecus coquereli]|uniref:spermatogenesis-associated protein 31E1-like n=1 Tax=Propithecus coquereli TaxID=379532 RepID=UPI00063EEC8C|nr:PREDICTED: spermatogenesis-associated protein 31E1-like [Propithecus coquereli]
MARNEPWEEEESVASGDLHRSESVLQLTIGSQSSGAEETKEPVEAKEEKPPAWEATLGASVRTDSHTLNVNLSSGSLRNRRSSQPSIIYVTQDPEELCINAPTVSECEVAVEVEPENQPQGPAPDVLLQDRATCVILEDCDPDILLAADIWAFQATLSSSQSKSTAGTRGPYESQSKRSGPTDERERRQEEHRQNCKPASATAQRAEPVTRRSFMDARTDEVQELVTTVGQILEEEIGPSYELPASKGNWYKEELQATTGFVKLEAQEGVKTENNDHINLKVAGQDGSAVQFKIKRHTPLSKLMKAYCERQGLSMRQIRFRFDGQPINETDTPAQLEMEDEDTIDVFQQQTGGVY